MSISKMGKVEGEGLRAAFKDSLGKLVQISTREQANKELRSLVTQNKTTINLRLWLSVLSENRARHSESEINVMTFIVQQYGRGLLDPLDKIPSLQKTIFRITQLLIKLYFKDENQTVALALQKAWTEIYLNALIDEEPALKKRLLYDCLEAILNGGADRLSQCTAQVVMEGVLETSLNRQDFNFFKQIAKRSLVLFLKTNIPHPAILTCLQTVLGYFSIINLLPLLDNIINKILAYAAQAPSNSTGYKMKAEAANCLTLIGEQLDQNGVQVQQKVIKALEGLATDKVWAVQVTGRKSLGIWKAKKKQWETDYSAKQEQFYPTAQQFYQPPEEQPTPLNRPMTAENFRPKTVDDFAKPERSQSPHQKFPDYSQGRYLHKNTGVGGGNTVQSVEQYYQRQKPQETYGRKMQQIKKSIYKPKQDYTEYDETIPWDQAQQLPTPLKPPPALSEVKSQLSPEDSLIEEQKIYLNGWQRVIQLIEKGRKQESAKAILQLDDDIYFLRYMLKYGKGLLAELTRPTAAKMLKQMLSINKTHFMEQLLLKLSAQTAKSGTGHILSNQQCLSISEALSKCGKIAGLQKPSAKVKHAFEKSLDH